MLNVYYVLGIVRDMENIEMGELFFFGVYSLGGDRRINIFFGALLGL